MTIEDMIRAQFVLFRYAQNKDDDMFKCLGWYSFLQDFFNT
jgi:hypothetical protein